VYKRLFSCLVENARIFIEVTNPTLLGLKRLAAEKEQRKKRKHGHGHPLSSLTQFLAVRSVSTRKYLIQTQTAQLFIVAVD
jgi:hypothetical protein